MRDLVICLLMLGVVVIGILPSITDTAIAIKEDIGLEPKAQNEKVYGSVITSAEPVSDKEITEAMMKYIEKYADEYNICPEYVTAIAEQSKAFSTSYPDRSYIGVMGLNEFSDKSYIDNFKSCDISDNETNVRVGVYKLRRLFEAYDDPYLVAMMYEPGDKVAAQLEWENGQLSDFAIKVVERSAELERLHNK